MKKSESDGTDLIHNKSFNMIAAMLLMFTLTPSFANSLHLYSTQDAHVYQGILISNSHTYSITGIQEDHQIQGLITDQMVVNLGIAPNSVNDGTGNAIDSVNDGTGNAIDSVNDGTGNAIDSVNDGTGLNASPPYVVWSLSLNNCHQLFLEVGFDMHDIKLNTITVDNQPLVCQNQ